MNNDVIKKDDIIQDGKLTTVGCIALILVMQKVVTLFFQSLDDKKDDKNE